MKLVSVDDLKGTEVLGMPIVSSGNVILIGEGTILNDSYIAKLRELGVSSVYVGKPGEARPVNNFTVEETYEQSREKIKTVLEKHVYKHNEDLKNVLEEADRILTNVAQEPEVMENLTEVRNISTDLYSHSLNVCTLSTIMALKLKMTEEQTRNVAIGAILHDIGLKFTTVECRDIDVDELGPEEQGEYKKHTVNGYGSIQDEKWLTDVAKDIILLHHERVDGGGYPFQYTGAKLRPEVKLVAVCDDFDSMISGVGRKRMKMHEAIEYIKVNEGVLYDSSVASKLLKAIAVYPVGTIAVTNEGEQAEVIRQNPTAPERPVIRMLKHQDGTPYDSEVVYDMMRKLTVFIVDTID
jgi:HD-GYP domain-containing protein (c-di-GMP phosphodiesterase class II)